jgi:TRAP-type mannitol/chloroaromatic compound transport system permease small subunit
MQQAPSAGLIRTVQSIDKFTDRTGILIAWLNIPLVLAVAYEVIARYLFNAPTIWSFDVSYMMYGTIFMLGAAFALHKGAHIRTISSTRNGAIGPAESSIPSRTSCFFFPSIVMLLFGERQ